MTPEEATIEGLRRWSQILLWLSIVLPALGALAVGARYYVERYERQLSSQLTSAAIQKAHNDVSSARAELNDLKQKAAPRSLMPSQRAAMLPALAALKGRPVAFACRMMDGESCDYALELAKFFLESGLQVPEPIKTSVNDLPGYLAITVPGKADPEVSTLLVDVFKAAGIDARLESIKQNSVGTWYTDVVHVIIGRKRP